MVATLGIQCFSNEVHNTIDREAKWAAGAMAVTISGWAYFLCS